jgi:dTDP-4-amino-4,6-dideoxygalactose transaminase
LYGMPAKIKEISEIASRYNIPLVEDAAEALGSKYKGQACGTFGIIGIYSFNGNKIITTSGGGALVSNNLDYIRDAKFYATQARDKAPHYQHSKVGYNYRMSNVIAGIGRGQLEVLEDRVIKRREINKFYRELLKKYNYISFQNEIDDHFSNNWLTTIIVNLNKGDITNEKIRFFMESNNIETRPLWKPMHLQPVFEGFPVYLNGNSEHLFQLGLCLPSGSNLSENELARITDCLKKVLDS